MIRVADLHIHPDLYALSQGHLLDGLEIGVEAFWAGLAQAVADFAPRNRDLLARRAQLQDQITQFYGKGGDQSPAGQMAFLRDIGYLTDDPAPLSIDPVNIDPEIAEVAGPQLVVPVMNARFALNAANALGLTL